MDNLKLWNSVCKTDPKHTKAANVRGNKITAIAPQSQIMAATEAFGEYGHNWGFKDIELDYSMLDKTGIVVFKGVFFYCKDLTSESQFPIISSISAYKDGAMTKPDADFAKKVETDALTKALSKLGFNADVFMGLYDDNKYVQMMHEEFNKPVASPELIAAIQRNAGSVQAVNQAVDHDEDFPFAVQCYDEISPEDNNLMWIAPTECKKMGIEPIYSTKARNFLTENASQYRKGA